MVRRIRDDPCSSLNLFPGSRNQHIVFPYGRRAKPRGDEITSKRCWPGGKREQGPPLSPSREFYPDQQLPMQPAPACGRSEQAALECLQRRVAINGADERAVAGPGLLSCVLVPICRKRGDDANAIRFAQLRMQRSRDRTERRRVDTVPRALELDAFETPGRFVHLEENDHRYSAETSPGEDDVGIAVAKVDGPGQCFCLLREAAEELA